jgi:hypothetical protein
VSNDRGDVQLERTVAFRPAWLASKDRVLGEQRGGAVDEVAVEARPGAVPPPAPSRPAPRTSLRDRHAKG